jgi:crossover junction endodeoxyribonuclease RusA
MQYTLPWPPSINHYYRQHRGRIYVTHKGKAYRRLVYEHLMAQLVRDTPGRLAVHIVVHQPDRRKRDLDNLLKCLLDALQHGGAFADDSHIDDLHIVRGSVDRPGGHVEVQVTTIDGGLWAAQEEQGANGQR